MGLLEQEEIITLVVNTMMGCSAYIGYQVNVKKQKLTIAYIIFTFLMALFVANLIMLALDAGEKESWKSVGILMGAFSATYMIEWFDKDSLDIFRRILELFLGKKDKYNDNDDYS